MGKNELEFYKNLAIIVLKYVPSCASGGGPTRSDLFHADLEFVTADSFSATSGNRFRT